MADEAPLPARGGCRGRRRRGGRSHDQPRAQRQWQQGVALRTLERQYEWRPSGLLFTAGWGPAYFTGALGVATPIPVATALSDLEQPAIDDYHLCQHLASDDEARLAAIESALVHGTPVPGLQAEGSLTSPPRCGVATRGGFVGAGLPADRQDVGGVPSGPPSPGTRRCSWDSSRG